MTLVIAKISKTHLFGLEGRVKELQNLNIQEFREFFFKPFRIIYRIIDKKVYVLLIVDGRRDMQSLLQRRLLKA